MKQFVMGFGVVAGMMFANVSFAESQVVFKPKTPLNVPACEKTRLGCQPSDYALPVGNALSGLLLAKLPVISKPSEINFQKTVGAAIDHNGEFAIVKCTLKTGRALFQYCTITESNTSENLKVFTPVQFLQLLNK